MFFHEIAYGIDDDWKQTWTTCPINGKKDAYVGHKCGSQRS
jgi:hypothetical protein